MNKTIQWKARKQGEKIYYHVPLRPINILLYQKQNSWFLLELSVSQERIICDNLLFTVL